MRGGLGRPFPFCLRRKTARPPGGKERDPRRPGRSPGVRAEARPRALQLPSRVVPVWPLWSPQRLPRAGCGTALIPSPRIGTSLSGGRGRVLARPVKIPSVPLTARGLLTIHSRLRRPSTSHSFAKGLKKQMELMESHFIPFSHLWLSKGALWGTFLYLIVTWRQ